VRGVQKERRIGDALGLVATNREGKHDADKIDIYVDI
jgi:hypothetical protein